MNTMATVGAEELNQLYLVATLLLNPLGHIRGVENVDRILMGV